MVCAVHTLMQFLDAGPGSLVKRNLQEYLMDDRSKGLYNSIPAVAISYVSVNLQNLKTRRKLKGTCRWWRRSMRWRKK